MKMKQSVAALIIGGFFGAGLAMAGMLNPAKVQGFLNITGQWDPSLMFVMIGGIGVAAIGFPLIRRRSGPILADSYSWPELVILDRPLLLGAAIFGIGWGLGGLCPGPAIAVLSIAFWPAALFTASMLAGLFIGQKLKAAQ